MIYWILDLSGINSSYKPPQITGFVYFLKKKYVGFIKVV